MLGIIRSGLMCRIRIFSYFLQEMICLRDIQEKLGKKFNLKIISHISPKKTISVQK